MIRVLITGCSMHSYDLIRALKDNYDGEEIYVVGINCDDTALLRKGVDAGYVVPRITEESYIPTVIDICEKEKVDVAGRGPRSASRASREQRDTRVRKVVRDESFDDSETTHEIRA